MNAWHEQMIDAGWKPIYDAFNVLIQYQYERPKGKPIVLDAVWFPLWAGLQQTPPPF